MKQKLLFVLLMFFFAAGIACAEDNAPAKTYETITPQPTSSGDKIEVIEFFWYGCPHCFDLEPTLDKWLAAKPDDVEFRRIPAI
ncbi:MAG: thiol:disulfide interchange protein DsbA/DsbL, partial [Gammaproteobacteria bacterium]